MVSRYRFGIMAEYAVIVYLFCTGHKILHRRYKTKIGEVDIIAKRKNYLVAVEVKARKKKVQIGEVVAPRQFKRIVNAMKIFLSRNPKYYNCNIRIDVILISLWSFPKCIKNAWIEQ